MEKEHSSRDSYGPLFLVAAAVLWSLCGVLVKSVGFGGPSLAAMRGMISFVVYCCLRRPRPIKWNKIKVIGAFCYFMQGLLLVTANKLTTAGNATVLQNTSPICIMLLNMLILSQRPKKLDVFACALLCAGIFLAFAGSFSPGGAWGNVLALVSAVFYAGVFFTNRMEGANAFESLLLGNAMYFVLLPVVLLDPAVSRSTPRQWVMAVAFCLLSGAAAWLCFSRGIRTTSALRANFITMLEPILSPVWTFVFLQERMGSLSLLGSAVVIVTLIGYNLLYSRIDHENAMQNAKTNRLRQ